MYDLNGDGFVTEADAAMYAEMFNRINFNGDTHIDIFDQVLLAGEIEQVHKVYLPIILR